MVREDKSPIIKGRFTNCYLLVNSVKNRPYSHSLIGFLKAIQAIYQPNGATICLWLTQT